jgi:Zn-dependent metalloprotease
VIYRANQDGNSLRDNGYQPSNMNQYYTGSEDNLVHINSGVTNNAFIVLLTASGMNPKAEKYNYRCFATFYLTRTSVLGFTSLLSSITTDLKKHRRA